MTNKLIKKIIWSTNFWSNDKHEYFHVEVICCDLPESAKNFLIYKRLKERSILSPINSYCDWSLINEF